MTSVLKNMREALEFYDALGFESLPIKIVQKKEYCRRRKENIQNPETKRNLLQQLLKEIGVCTRCKLAEKRTNIVFGEGNPNARLMFIGEGPGREEDIQGRPFVGDAGLLLTRLIEKMGFKRDDVYIANIVKCRPPMNRDPDPEEMKTCKQFLEKQIEIIEPDIIMSLGRISALTLLENPELKITEVRGNFFDYHGIPLMPTFHPAYLIRNPKEKWKTWHDAQKVLSRLKQLEKSLA